MRPFASDDVLTQVTHELSKENANVPKPPSERQTDKGEPLSERSLIAKDKGFEVLRNTE